MAHQQFDDLRFPQQFVLWASRQWVVTGALPRWRDRLLAGAFGRLGIPQAAPALGQLLSALTAAESERVMFLRPCRCWLNADESAYLEILAALQAGSNGIATDRLGNWCPPRRLRQAYSAGRRVTALLSEAGLMLSPHLLNRQPGAAGCRLH